MVGDTEYFIEDELYTISDMEKMQSLQRIPDPQGVLDHCNSIVKRCLGEDVYSHIPMSDYAEVYAKTLAELFLPHNPVEREKMIADLITSFKISYD